MNDSDLRERFERWQRETSEGMVVPPLTQVRARARRHARQRRVMAVAAIAALSAAATTAGILAHRDVMAEAPHPAPAASPTSPPPSPSGKDTQKDTHAVRVPVPGWAGAIVRAGDSAYVTGWDAHDAAALWYVDTNGQLSPRTPPPGMPGNPGTTGDGAVQFLAFDGPDAGLAITGRSGSKDHEGHTALYATDDGARSWNRVELPTREQPEQMAIGGGAAYALTSNCARPTAACDHATLWSIDPTGSTAPHTFDSLPARTHTSGPIAIAAYGVDVWAFLNTGSGNGTVLRSMDGGRTWHRADDLCMSEEPVATSGSVLWSTCATGMLEHFTRQVGGGQPVSVFSTVSGTSNSVLLPLSDTTAYAVIEDRHGTHLQATRDGGHTTTTVAPIPRPIARRGFVTTFVSPQVGYLVTQNGGQLYRTTDAAHTWHAVPAPPQ